MNNYNSLMGIIAAINASSVQRLRHTKDLVKKKSLAAFAQLEVLMNPHLSWKEYRTALERSSLPTLPYLYAPHYADTLS
jgi:hypothetical protein